MERGMAKSILLVCDMINDLVHEDGPNGQKGYGPELARRRTIDHAEEAIRKAREAAVPVAYVRVGFSPDYRECPSTSRIFQGAKKAGMFKLGTWGTEVHPRLAPQPGDFDVVKHRVSPFYATSLEAILGALCVRKLYIFGVSTGGAVLSAAKDGHDRDYEVVVIEDACCALTETQHQAVVEQMNRLVTIVTSSSVTYDIS
jgi:nicotinamidase-related amidase